MTSLHVQKQQNLTIKRLVAFSWPSFIMTFPCERCGTQLSTKKLMKRHLVTVHGKKTHKCEQCRKAFSRKDGLDTHSRICKGRRYQEKQPTPGCIQATQGECSDQDEKARSTELPGNSKKAKLTVLPSAAEKQPVDLLPLGQDEHTHQILNTNHSNWKVTRPDRATGNPLQASVMNYLRLHRSRRQAIYPCSECNNTFTRKQHLLRHKRTLRDKKMRFACYCGKVCSRKANLLRHQRKLHPTTLNIEAVGKAVPVPSDVSSVTTQTQDDGMNLDLTQSSKPLLLTIRIDDAMKTDIQIVVAQPYERSSALCL